MGYLFLTSDPFTMPKDDEKIVIGGEELKNSYRNVRRPYRGIQIKEDTYATLSVRDSKGGYIPIDSSSSTKAGNPKVREYSDFILQNVQDQRMEKQQIIETFGDTYVYFLGEKTRIMQFSGMLVNSEDFNWRSHFWHNYDTYLRGTKLVQMNARAYIAWDTIVVEGYLIGANATEDASDQHNIPFSVTVVVTNYYDYSGTPTTRFPGQEARPFDVLNKELADKRKDFVSTTAAVRHQNYRAGFTGKGILSTLRSGIRRINEMTSVVGNFFGTVDRVLGGRTVRVPAGIAGYLYSVGFATVGAGGIGSSTMTSQFDAATGTFKSVTGSVKLRMPAVSQFAPPWRSGVDSETGLTRGHIFENTDEYPGRYKDDGTLHLALSDKESRKYQLLAQERAKKLDYVKERAMKENLVEGAGGCLEDLTEAVSFARSNFGTIMSAAAFVREPLPIIQDTLGFGRVVDFQNGAFTVREKALKERLSRFLGIEAAESFAGAITGAPVDISGQVLGTGNQMGQSYQSAAYRDGSDDINYEAAYGNKDYSALLESDPAAKDNLDEIFGDSDSAPAGTDVSADSLATVSGVTNYSSTSTSFSESVSMVQSPSEFRDEDALGIRGVADEDTIIEPIK